MSQSDLRIRADSAVTSDTTLVRLAQEGDLDAFTSLYERHLPVVYKRVRYSIPERDVEDVTQEVFITAMKSLRSFKGNAQFSTWLRVLVKRRIVDFYRRRDPNETELEVDISEADQLMPETLAVPQSNLDDQIALKRGMQALAEDYREILLLRFAEGLQFNEIAQVRGQSLEAVKSLFRRAVEALRRQMGEAHD